MPVKTLRVVTILSFILGISGTSAFAAQCEPPNGFATFLTTFKADAKAQGISPRAVAVLDGLTLEPQVIALDRKQDHFKQSFEQFSGSHPAADFQGLVDGTTARRDPVAHRTENWRA